MWQRHRIDNQVGFEMSAKARVYWRECRDRSTGIVERLELRSRFGKYSRCVATVWANGAWFTWDQHGMGGEIGAEDSMKQAKVEAAASAIEQGFI